MSSLIGPAPPRAAQAGAGLLADQIGSYFYILAFALCLVLSGYTAVLESAREWGDASACMRRDAPPRLTPLAPPLPTAGLADLPDTQEHAVIDTCLHTFCLPCLSAWLDIKRSCPLCKRRVGGYIFDIKSDTDYRERHIPPSPERCKDEAAAGGGAYGSRTSHALPGARPSRWGPLPAAQSSSRPGVVLRNISGVQWWVSSHRVHSPCVWAIRQAGQLFARCFAAVVAYAAWTGANI